MGRYLFALITVFTLLSCQPEASPNDPAGKTVFLDLAAATPYQFSDWFAEPHYTRLETQFASILRMEDFWRIEFDEQHIFILDEPQPLKKELKIFHKDGRYRSTLVNNQGEIGGYYNVYDFHTEQTSKEIELLDGAANRMVIYDFDGNFLRNKLIDHSFIFFTKFSPSEYLFFSGNTPVAGRNDNLYYWDTEKITESYLPIPKFLRNETMIFHHFSEVNTKGERLFSMPYSNDLYLIKAYDQRPELLIRFDLGSDWYEHLEISPALRGADLDNFISQNGKVFHFRYTAIFENNIFLQFYAGNRLYFCLIDRNSRTVKKLSVLKPRSDLTNDIDHGPLGIKVESHYQSQFAFWLNANRFKFQVENNAHQNPKLLQNKPFAKLYDMAQRMDYEDNPVLVFAELKLD